jgi:hypothetical protein
LKSIIRVLSTATVVLLVLALPLRGQSFGREISVAIGPMSWDASGTGTAPFAAIRTSGPIAGRWLLADFSLGYSSLDEQFSDINTRIGIAEGQLQLQYPARVRPYVGVGGGWLHYFNNAGGRRATPQTFSGATGIRFAISERMLLRGELRLRGWQPSGGSSSVSSAAEYTAGIGYVF